MEQEIRDMISELTTGHYDPEDTHGRYDDLLEKFILNFNEDLVPLMKVLISIEKDFWYA